MTLEWIYVTIRTPVDDSNKMIPQPFYGRFSGTTRVSRCQENFWTLWCKGRLTEADTPTIWLGAIPSRLTSAHLYHRPFFLQTGCRSCPQPTVSKHWRHCSLSNLEEKYCSDIFLLQQMLDYIKDIVDDSFVFQQQSAPLAEVIQHLSEKTQFLCYWVR